MIADFDAGEEAEATSTKQARLVRQQQATEKPQSDDSAEPPVPAFADARGDRSESGRKLVQVASLYPAAPTLQAATNAQDADAPGLAGRLLSPRKLFGARYSARDRECLARAMFFESNRSSRDGLVAVGSVVMNRLEAGAWGDTICSVVGAPRQFAPGVLSRPMNSAALPDVMAAADAVLAGERHPKIYKQVMHFHTAGYRFRYNNMHYVTVAGGNSFYEKRSRMHGRPNTPQHIVMAEARSGAEMVAKPVKAAFAAPIQAARSLFGDENEAPPTPKLLRRQKAAAEQSAPEDLPAEGPVPAAAEAPAPVAAADAGPYLKAPTPEFADAPAAKGGRVKRIQSSTR